MNNIKSIIKQYLPLVLITVFFVLNFLIIEQATTKRTLFFASNDVASFILISFLAIISMVGFLIFYRSKINTSNKKVRYIIYFLFFILLIGINNAIFSPATYNLFLKNNQQVIISLNTKTEFYQRIYSFILLLINVLFIAVLVLVTPRLTHFKKYVRIIATLMIIYGIILIVSSLVLEIDVYLKLLKIGYGPNINTEVPMSLYDNRNTFASFLTTSMLFSLFLYYVNKNNKIRFLYFSVVLFFIIFIFLTFSKTNMIISLIVFIFMLVRHFIKQFKRNKRHLIYDSLIVIVLVSYLILLRFNPVLKSSIPGTLINSFIDESLFDNGVKTILSRGQLWQLFFDLLVKRPYAIVFGDGVYLNRIIYHQYLSAFSFDLSTTGFGNYHNGYFEFLGAFGVIALIAYLLIFVLMFKHVIKKIKKHPNIGCFLLLLIVIFVLRGSVESVTLMLFKIDGILASLVLVYSLIYFEDEPKQVQHVSFA